MLRQGNSDISGPLAKRIRKAQVGQDRLELRCVLFVFRQRLLGKRWQEMLPDKVELLLHAACLRSHHDHRLRRRQDNAELAIFAISAIIGNSRSREASTSG